VEVGKTPVQLNNEVAVHKSDDYSHSQNYAYESFEGHHQLTASLFVRTCGSTLRAHAVNQPRFPCSKAGARIKSKLRAPPSRTHGATEDGEAKTTAKDATQACRHLRIVTREKVWIWAWEEVIELGKAYLDYWQALKLDTADFAEPSEDGAATSNKQGKDLRTENAGELPTTTVDSTTVTPWRSPNTPQVTKGAKTPPDLSAVYSLMRKAKHAIFFAVFMPSVKGATSIVEEAINLGENDSSLLVYGSVSDPKVMPNYIAPGDGGDDSESDTGDEKRKQPATYDNANVHLVQAAALVKGNIVGDFETELQSAGNAIIHDKIVVIDPLSPDCVVITGSHNLGYKASYENDENLVIMRGNPQVAQAYMVHLLDLYEHYRYRAAQLDQHNKGEKLWSGFLDRNDRWLANYTTGDKRALSQYLGR
jgi:hypothetical protein